MPDTDAPELINEGFMMDVAAMGVLLGSGVVGTIAFSKIKSMLKLSESEYVKAAAAEMKRSGSYDKFLESYERSLRRAAADKSLGASMKIVTRDTLPETSDEDTLKLFKDKIEDYVTGKKFEKWSAAEIDGEEGFPSSSDVRRFILTDRSRIANKVLGETKGGAS